MAISKPNLPGLSKVAMKAIRAKANFRGTPPRGTPPQGTPPQGTPPQGTPPQGMPRLSQEVAMKAIRGTPPQDMPMLPQALHQRLKAFFTGGRFEDGGVVKKMTKSGSIESKDKRQSGPIAYGRAKIRFVADGVGKMKKGAAPPMHKMPNDSMMKDSDMADIIGRVVKRKTADVKGRAMKKGK